MNEVCFENQFEDYSSTHKTNITSYLEDEKLKPIDKLKKYETSVWERSFKNYDREEDYSVYTGSSGIALLKFLIASKKGVEMQRRILEDTIKLIPVNKLNGRRITFLCGDAGPLAIAAVIENKLGHTESSLKLIKQLLKLGDGILDINSNIPNELLYGRAGYLYALLFVKKYVVDSPIQDQFIEQIIDVMIKAGQKEAKALKMPTHAPLMYSWHDSYYLGAAHGLSGILYMFLQARKYIEPEILSTIVKPAIDYLTTLRFSSENFPSSLGKERDKLVQWCHGAPGYTHLYCLAYEVFREEKYLKIALDCGNVVWSRGILTKGYSICHGVSGNAYTFLQLFKTTGDAKHLHRAVKFAEWVADYTSSHEYHYPDRPLSLFEGLAGRLYFIVDINDPMNAKFPAYEL